MSNDGLTEGYCLLWGFSLSNFSKTINDNYLTNEASYQKIKVDYDLTWIHSEKIKKRFIKIHPAVFESIQNKQTYFEFYLIV